MVPIESAEPGKGEHHMMSITTKDFTQIYYKDWGKGQPVVFSHGRPLSSDAFEDQMLFLADRGYRCIAHDRRGHGRSSQPWEGNDMNTWLKVIPGGPHGMCSTLKDQVNAELLSFIKGVSSTASA
jgi:alpha-beta hydrolase superfamily lysophospholipase